VYGSVQRNFKVFSVPLSAVIHASADDGEAWRSPLRNNATPRYFFNVSDGADLPDVEGIVLQDRAAARTQAITTAGEMLKERGCTFWHGTEWRMTVLDEAGTTVCLLRFTAE